MMAWSAAGSCCNRVWHAFAGSGIRTKDGRFMDVGRAEGVLLASFNMTTPSPANNLIFRPVPAPGPSLTARVPLVISGPGNSASCLTVANNTSPVQLKPACDTINPPATDAFTALRPDGMTGTIAPGDTMYLLSNATGKFCRAIDLDSNSSLQAMVCDLDSPEGAPAATRFTYTGWAPGMQCALGEWEHNPSRSPTNVPTACMLLQVRPHHLGWQGPSAPTSSSHHGVCNRQPWWRRWLR
jgi:hypothetical protein